MSNTGPSQVGVDGPAPPLVLPLLAAQLDRMPLGEKGGPYTCTSTPFQFHSADGETEAQTYITEADNLPTPPQLEPGCERLQSGLDPCPVLDPSCHSISLVPTIFTAINKV